MNDWSISISHLTNRVTMLSRLSLGVSGRLEDAMFIGGPNGAKETVGVLGQSILRFLREHGVVLPPIVDERKFVNPALIANLTTGETGDSGP